VISPPVNVDDQASQSMLLIQEDFRLMEKVPLVTVTTRMVLGIVPFAIVITTLLNFAIRSMVILILAKQVHLLILLTLKVLKQLNLCCSPMYYILLLSIQSYFSFKVMQLTVFFCAIIFK